MYTLESLPVCLLKAMNWEHRSVKRNYIQKEMIFSALAEGTGGVPSCGAVQVGPRWEAHALPLSLLRFPP